MAETALWRDILRPALTTASLSDGRAFVPERVDASEAWNVVGLALLVMSWQRTRLPQAWVPK